MVHNIDIIGLCHICRNVLKNLCDVAYMSYEVAALSFQANDNYRTWSIEFAPVLKYELQSTQILLLSSKYEIIIVPTNHSFFQYCDFSLLLPVKLSFFIILASFLVSLLCFFFVGSLSKVIALSRS